MWWNRTITCLVYERSFGTNCAWYFVENVSLTTRITVYICGRNKKGESALKVLFLASRNFFPGRGGCMIINVFSLHKLCVQILYIMYSFDRINDNSAQNSRCNKQKQNKYAMPNTLHTQGLRVESRQSLQRGGGLQET